MFTKRFHDGVTLDNNKNNQSLDLKLIDPFWKNNFVVCCGFAYTKNNKDSGIEDIFKKKVKSITGHYITYIMVIMVADWATIGVSTQLNLDEIE